MPEFTIRNKSTHPILTLRPPILAAMLAARPDSSSLVLSKYCRDYKRLTGKEIHIDHEQHLAFLKRYGADTKGTWASPYSTGLGLPWFEVQRVFKDGFLARTISRGFLADLAVAEAFYSLLDARLGTAQA